WRSRRHGTEPVPPEAWFHDADAVAVRLGTLRREGRMLLATHRCTACHAVDVPARTAMPELAMRAPSLEDAGARLEEAWVRAFVHEPRTLRPDARMPTVLHGEPAQRAQDAADLAAWLATRGAEAAAPEAGDPAT